MRNTPSQYSPVFTTNNHVSTHLQGDPNVPGGQVTFEVDLRRPVTDDPQPEPGQEHNLGQCSVREFDLPPSYEARYTNFPNTYVARYTHDILLGFASKSLSSYCMCRSFLS